MGQTTLQGPDSKTKLPNTRDETPENGWSIKRIVDTINTMFTELYENVVFAGTAKTVSGQLTFSTDPMTSVGVGADGGAAIATAEYGNDAVHKTVLTLTALSITMTDAGAAGSHGTAPIYTFPEGAIQILGVQSNLEITAGAGGIADDAALVYSIGSDAVGTDNATLTSAEADLIASTACTLETGEGLADARSSVITTVFDGTADAIVANLNVAVPDADSSASDTVSVTGVVTILWSNLGNV